MQPAALHWRSKTFPTIRHQAGCLEVAHATERMEAGGHYFHKTLQGPSKQIDLAFQTSESLCSNIVMSVNDPLYQSDM